MTDYLQLKKTDKMWISPPFYTHTQGYKMCLKVYPNGDGIGKGTHVSIFARLMRGEYDDQLQWPFQGQLISELLNWREDKRHKIHTVDFRKHSSSRVCARVTDWDVETGLGNPLFIRHSSLSYNPTANTEYLQDDCLRLRVKTVAVYSM